jgi:hypothetical protein
VKIKSRPQGASAMEKTGIRRGISLKNSTRINLPGDAKRKLAENNRYTG